MGYVMLALIVLMVVFVGINLCMPTSASFGRIFYPLAVAFVLPQLAIPFLSDACTLHSWHRFRGLCL